MDCDGDIRLLAPLWLEVGITPCSRSRSGRGKPIRTSFRRRFGKELRLLGGFDKNILRQSPEAIAAEVRRLAPLVEEGGFVPHCDHLVPPDVPYANYLFYLEQARAIWGRGLDLPPSRAR